MGSAVGAGVVWRGAITAVRTQAASSKVEKLIRSDRNKEVYSKPEGKLYRKRKNAEWKAKLPKDYKHNPHRPKRKQVVVSGGGNEV